MNRSTAREIAMHLTFELAFSDIKVDDLLERELNADAFAARAADEPPFGIYGQSRYRKDYGGPFDGENLPCFGGIAQRTAGGGRPVRFGGRLCGTDGA